MPPSDTFVDLIYAYVPDILISNPVKTVDIVTYLAAGIPYIADSPVYSARLEGA